MFVAALIAAHLAHPELTPTRSMVSEYANQGHGWVITVGFASWAASLGLSALAFRWAPMRSALMIAAAGAGLVSAFKTQAVSGDVPPGVPRSAAGRAHDVGGELLLAGLALAAVLLSLRSSAAPQGLRRTAGALFAAAIGLIAGFLAAGDPWPGLRQRVSIAAAVGLHWVLLAAAATDERNSQEDSAVEPGRTCRDVLDR